MTAALLSLAACGSETQRTATSSALDVVILPESSGEAPSSHLACAFPPSPGAYDAFGCPEGAPAGDPLSSPVPYAREDGSLACGDALGACRAELLSSSSCGPACSTGSPVLNEHARILSESALAAEEAGDEGADSTETPTATLVLETSCPSWIPDPVAELPSDRALVVRTNGHYGTGAYKNELGNPPAPPSGMPSSLPGTEVMRQDIKPKPAGSTSYEACRGACGPDCGNAWRHMNACTRSEVVVHTCAATCTYEKLECRTHPICQGHDSELEKCDQTHPPGVRRTLCRDAVHIRAAAAAERAFPVTAAACLRAWATGGVVAPAHCWSRKDDGSFALKAYSRLIKCK